MGRVNAWLKWSFICVISLKVVVSVLLLTVSSLSMHSSLQDKKTDVEDIHLMYSLTIPYLIFAIFGLYGACKMKKWALIVSAVGMILGSLVSMVLGIEGLALRSLAIEDTKKELLSWLPPNNASEDAIKDLSSIHIFFECCGLDQGYQDWGYNIPDSCLCTEESTNPCVAAPRHSSLYEYNDDDKPIKIYQEPCLSYFMEMFTMVLNILLGFMMGIGVSLIFSTVLCILILCQLKNKEDVPAVV